jgi:hypothetical protein
VIGDAIVRERTEPVRRSGRIRPIIVLLAGFGVFTGNVLARTVGVVVAAVSKIANFLWLPVYPVWSLIIITIDVLVIWALMAHGGEMREPSSALGRFAHRAASSAELIRQGV